MLKLCSPIAREVDAQVWEGQGMYPRPHSQATQPRFRLHSLLPRSTSGRLGGSSLGLGSELLTLLKHSKVMSAMCFDACKALYTCLFYKEPSCIEYQVMNVSFKDPIWKFSVCPTPQPTVMDSGTDVELHFSLWGSVSL